MGSCVSPDALVAKLLVWYPCCVCFWIIIRHCSLYACVHNWKSKNYVTGEVKLMLSDSLSVEDEDKKGNWSSLMNLGGYLGFWFSLY